MKRPKLSVPVMVRLPQAVYDAVEAHLRDDETLARFMRQAVSTELQQRETSSCSPSS